MQALLRRGTSFLSSVSSFKEECENEIIPAEESLFPKVDPAVDGDDCDHDCASCTIRFPTKFSIDMEDKLYGNVEQWSTHLLVATGKTDWVRDVADEEGSVMEAIEKGGLQPTNGKLMLSASNIPVPDEYHHHEPGAQPTTVLLLPSFTVIDHVTPVLSPDLINYFVNSAPTTTTVLDRPSQATSDASPATSIYSEDATTTTEQQQHEEEEQDDTITPSTIPTSLPPLSKADLAALTPLRSRPCPHAAVILLCSQRTRDVRCGQSAPLLRREFERHLRAHGLYRDMNDERPGGVGVYFISHVGGHRYSANVMVYRRRDFDWYRKGNGYGRGQVTIGEGNGDGEENVEEEQDSGEAEEEGAAQGIWLARVKPADCEGIIKYTVLQGKVVKPKMQLRGGFDREKGLVSW